MKVEKCRHTVKCDADGCRNLAVYYITTRGFIKNEFAFCDKCLKELYAELAKLFVPKAIESHFKQGVVVKRRKNEK